MTDESKPLEPWVGTANGRGSFGQFARGNKLATGNPNAKRHAELKKALMDCATADDIKAIFDMLLKSAKGGDIQAAKLLLDHLVGRPSQAIELTSSDGGDKVEFVITHRTAGHGSDSLRDGEATSEPASDRGLLGPI